MLVKILNKFNSQAYPLDDTAIDVPDEILALIKEDGEYCFDVENNCVIPYDNTEYVKAVSIEELRQRREPLLQAFDVYKSNVSYGIEADVNRVEIITWYNSILDLDEEAINNPPIEIRRYM